MTVESIVTAPGFREVIFNFLWHVIELVYMIAVIAYVSYTLDFPRGYWGGRREPSGEIPAAAVGNSWSTAASFLQDAGQVARTLKESLAAPPTKPTEPIPAK